MTSYPFFKEPEKHKVFISYYHKDDQYYRDKFEELFGHLFINKSVKDGDIDSDLSADYIKRLIQLGYITDASVVLVLVGPKTYCRKHVDWEISAGLNKKVGGYSGLLGILVPDFKLSAKGEYQYSDIPARLADNIKTKYAEMYTWSYACSSELQIKNVIETAFQNRISKANQIDNSREQMKRNTCE